MESIYFLLFLNGSLTNFGHKLVIEDEKLLGSY